jgi:hypothetical protein
MAARGALTVLMILLLSAAAEATNYKKYNSPTWGSRWHQILKNKPHVDYKHPYVTGR